VLGRCRLPIPRLTLAALIGALAILPACKTTNPEAAAVVAQPDTPVVKNITSFSNSLRCMDQLFLDYGKRGIVITSDGLPDATGTINAGTKDMMITTLSKMSERSNAFRFVDIHRHGALEYIQTRTSQNYAIPNFYIRGAITQVDRNVASDSVGGGIAIPMASLGYSEDQLLSVVTLDLNIGDTDKRQIIPGLHTTNTITVVLSGRGGEAEGVIEKASLWFEVEQDRRQGSHQAVRTLIELGLIEVLGKLTKVPYWRCLELDTTDPTLIAQARGWYDRMTRAERIRVVQAALKKTGDYTGPVTGMTTTALQRAVNAYKAQNDLIANGRVDFDIYYRLLADNRAVVPTDDALADSRGERGGTLTDATYRPQTPARPTAAANPAGYDPYGLQVRPVDSTGGYSVGDSLTLAVDVGQPAHVYCYYEYADGSDTAVTRIFPNRWQRNSLVAPGRTVRIPGPNADFRLVLSTAGAEEQVSCMAVGEAYRGAETPLALTDRDLEPITQARGLWEIVQQHQKARPEPPSVQTVRWTVR
jgi:curli biogenesis system outer membrane secretion channel CsgG